MPETLLVDSRFCGPPGAGNGGYVCGRLASFADGPVEVTIRRAVPLGRPLVVERTTGGSVLLRDGDVVLAEAAPAPAADSMSSVPRPPSFAAAVEAAKAFPRALEHPVSRCFVCGTDRAPGDGLRIFPGPVPGSDLYAAPWTPDASLSADGDTVAPEHLWAALDCTGAFAVNEPPRGLALLGRLAARIYDPVAVGERTIVTGWPLGADGRKLYAGTAVSSETGVVRAAARATWILTG